MNNGVLVITPTKTYDVAHSQEDEESYGKIVLLQERILNIEDIGSKVIRMVGQLTSLR